MSDNIDEALRTHSASIADLESRWSSLREIQNDQSTILPQIQQLLSDVAKLSAGSLQLPLEAMEKTLIESGGDTAPALSLEPLRMQEVDLRRRLNLLESGVNRNVDGQRENDVVNSSLLVRGTLIRQRMEDLGSQLSILNSTSTAVDPDTLFDRLEDLEHINKQVILLFYLYFYVPEDWLTY